ncbi:MAG: hypothetical protein AB7V27_06305 [Candidatus Binatia bacterium]
MKTAHSTQQFAAGGLDAREVAREYVRWLARFSPLLRVSGDPEGEWRVHLGFRRVPALLAFANDTGCAHAERIVFHVRGGLLAAPRPHGALEFRSARGGQAVQCSVRGFLPRLPWPVYACTQSPVHRLVMAAFGRHLRRRAGAR